MAYDLGNKLTTITPSSGPAISFTFDALGRFASRMAAGSVPDIYSYVGGSETVARIDPFGGTTTDSLVSPAGDRLGVKRGATLNWFLPDPHGNIAGSLDAAETTVVNAIRYDAYGQTVLTGSAGGTAVGANAWKYQGRLDIGPAGSTTPLYDMSARFYAPGLGSFTQLDSVMGSAQNPLSMNRFLYAEANPATLIDPTGHRACEYDCEESEPTRAETKHSHAVAIQTAQTKEAKSTNDAPRSQNLDDRETNTVVLHLSNRERLHLIWEYSRRLDWLNEDERKEICHIWGQDGWCRTPGLDPSSDLWRVLFGDPFDEHTVALAGGWDRISRILVGAEKAVGPITSVSIPRLGGRYELKNESMKAFARAFQARATNVAEGFVYRYGGVAFDAEGLGRAAVNVGRPVLVNAKSLKAGSGLIDKVTGGFKSFMFTAKNERQMLGEVIAADGVPIEYWVSSEAAARAWPGYVDSLRLNTRITVVVVP